MTLFFGFAFLISILKVAFLFAWLLSYIFNGHSPMPHLLNRNTNSNKTKN